MKNDKQPSGWKNELLSGLVELAFYVICGAVGLGILFLLPDEMTENTPFELFCTLGCFVIIAIGVIVGWIANMRKTKKQTKDLKLIYKRLKGKYTVTLMTLTRKAEGKMVDVPVIRGRSSEGRFELSKDGQAFRLSVEFFSKYGDEKYILAHPHDANDAVACIEKFMSDT
jgi:hypothetical protein